MEPRERVSRVLNFQEADRVPLAESLFWSTTLRAWQKQGLPSDCNIYEYFNLEVHRVRTELSLRLPTRVIEETREYVIKTNPDGVVEKWAQEDPDVKGVQHLEYLIKTPEDWEANKHRMSPEGRVDERYLNEWKHYDSLGDFMFFYTRGPFWSACNKIDYMQFNYWLYDHPETVKDMIETEGECIMGIWKEATEKGCVFQGAYLLDIIGMKDYPYISPEQYREFVKPTHTRVCSFFREKGYPVMLHSDGNIKPLIPDLIEAGFTAITPVETRAHMDLIELKEQYGDRLAFMGGIDVDILRTADKEKIDEEIRNKVTVAKEHGGFIFHSDGSIPPDVTMESYQFALEMALEYGKY